jgi:hypothetical protein
MAARSEGTATFQPEPTQHSKPTFVWAYISRRVATFNPTCLFRLLPTTVLLFLYVLIVGDVAFT